jgi:hypothetical protein
MEFGNFATLDGKRIFVSMATPGREPGPRNLGFSKKPGFFGEAVANRLILRYHEANATFRRSGVSR